MYYLFLLLCENMGGEYNFPLFGSSRKYDGIKKPKGKAKTELQIALFAIPEKKTIWDCAILKGK